MTTKNSGGVDVIPSQLQEYSVPLNKSVNDLTDLIRGHQDVGVAGSGSYTLSVTDGDPEARVPVVRLTGTLTGARTVKIPATGGGRVFIIHNDTSGSYAVTVTTDQGGSTGVSVPQGYAQHVFHNGTNVIPAAPAVKASYSTLNDLLVAYYRLDEFAGMRLDSVGTSHLTDNNTVTQAVGKIGAAGQFTAANSEYLSVADNATLSMSNIEFTVCAWVYLDSKGAVRTAVAKRVSSAGGGEFGLVYDSGADRFNFSIFDSTTGVNSAVANTFGSPSTGTWYFLVGKVEGGNVKISVNNGTMDSTAKSVTIPDSAASFLIGAQQNTPAFFWDGRIDGVGVWKRALTAAEITELYNSGNGKPYPF